MAKFDTAARWDKTYEDAVDGIQAAPRGKKFEAETLLQVLDQPTGRYQDNLRDLIDIHASITAFFEEFGISR